MRQNQIERLITIAFTVSTVTATPFVALGQSGSRTTNPSPPLVVAKTNAAPDGSADSENRTPVGLRGYCPVCLVDMRQWIKGDERLTIEFDGRKYYFPGNKQAQKFKQDPLKYVPVLGGDDIVLFAKSGDRIDGNLNYAVVHKGRTYLFATEEGKRLFQAAPTAYENADLALDGDCIVCRVDMHQRVHGKPDVTSLYQGIRYQFPDKERQTNFLKMPDRYVAALARSASPASDSLPASKLGQPTSGSGTR